MGKERTASVGAPLRAPRRTLEERDARRLMRFAWGAVVTGVLLRVAAALFMDAGRDGNPYLAMGHAWSLHHEFLLPYGEFAASPGPSYSHHFPPAYPFYLGLVFSAFGYGLVQAKAAALVMSLAALGVVYFATRDLYGERAAALLTGLVALEPHLVWATGTGYSESMVVAFFTLTMWAIVKSLEDDRYIVLAGLFAGLAYLSRASMGPFFIIAGLGGLAWRLHYRGLRVLANRWYLAAIAVFGASVGLWALRNLRHFGWPHWETSAYLSAAYAHAFSEPAAFTWGLVAKGPFFLLLFAFYAAPFASQMGRSVRRIREESTSALWLSVALLWVLGWIVSAVLYVHEAGSPVFYLEHHRYVLVGLIPLGWALLRETKGAGETLPRWTVLAAAMLLASASVLAYPIRDSSARATEWLDPHLREGDFIFVTGNLGPFSLYAPMSDPLKVTVGRGLAPDMELPEFIVTHDARPPLVANYTFLGVFRQEHLFQRSLETYVLARDDVALERALPTNVTRVSW